MVTSLKQNSSELKVVLTNCFSPTVSQFQLHSITPIYPQGSLPFTSQVTNQVCLKKAKLRTSAYSVVVQKAGKNFIVPPCPELLKLKYDCSSTFRFYLKPQVFTTSTAQFDVRVSISPVAHEERQKSSCCSSGLCCYLKVWTYMKTSIRH